LAFSGRVTEISHAGGLLASFEGRSPNLGDTIRVSGGKVLGRVDSVIGPVDSGLVHIHPIFDGVDSKRAIGSPVEVAPRGRSNGRRHQSGKKRGGPRGKGPRREGQRSTGPKKWERSRKTRGGNRGHNKGRGRGSGARKGHSRGRGRR
tara:strand:- start:5346 stop:5789 length:444 start_codon:yes stop_codon:yes gene_type:complete